MTKTKRLVAVVGAALLLILAIGSTPDAAALTGPTVFAAHPSIAAQPASGRVIRDLAVDDGRLFMGHGDWTGNTGPIDVAWVDLATGATGVALEDTPTEAITVYRSIAGELYAPWIDPTGWGGMPGGNGGFTSSAGGWHNTHTFPAAHVFDVASYGGDLFLAGAGGNTGAVIYRSRDGGTTWTLAVDERSPGGVTEWERFYWMGTAGGKLYAQAAHKGYSTGCGCSSSVMFPLRVWDGTRWAKAPDRGSPGDVRSASDVESFRGLIYSPLYVTNGKRRAALGAPFWPVDFWQDASRLWIVSVTGQVAYTPGVTSPQIPTWTTLPGVAVPAGVTAASVAVAGSNVYVGTTAGQVYLSST